MRVAPAEKELIEREASCRGVTKSLLLTSLGFEEIQPSGRTVPRPKIFGWLYDKGQDLLEDAGGHLASLPSRLLGHAADLKMKDAEVRMRQAAREDLWDEAAGSSRSERIGVRLKARKKEWIKGEASKRGTSMSTLLRDSMLEGIAKRDHMSDLAGRLLEWAIRADSLASRDAVAEENIRGETKTIADEVRSYAQRTIDSRDDRGDASES